MLEDELLSVLNIALHLLYRVIYVFHLLVDHSFRLRWIVQDKSI